MTFIGGIITYQSFKISYPNEVLSTSLLVLQKTLQTLIKKLVNWNEKREKPIVKLNGFYNYVLHLPRPQNT